MSAHPQPSVSTTLPLMGIPPTDLFAHMLLREVLLNRYCRDRSGAPYDFTRPAPKGEEGPYEHARKLLTPLGETTFAPRNGMDVHDESPIAGYNGYSLCIETLPDGSEAWRVGVVYIGPKGGWVRAWHIVPIYGPGLTLYTHVRSFVSNISRIPVADLRGCSNCLNLSALREASHKTLAAVRAGRPTRLPASLVATLRAAPADLEFALPSATLFVSGPAHRKSTIKEIQTPGTIYFIPVGPDYRSKRKIYASIEEHGLGMPAIWNTKHLHFDVWTQMSPAAWNFARTYTPIFRPWIHGCPAP